jgi:hypothetical protein
MDSNSSEEREVVIAGNPSGFDTGPDRQPRSVPGFCTANDATVVVAGDVAAFQAGSDDQTRFCRLEYRRVVIARNPTRLDGRSYDKARTLDDLLHGNTTLSYPYGGPTLG